MSADLAEQIARVSHEEAREIMSRLVAGSFRRDGEQLEHNKRPRFSIPARPEHDDDLRLAAYIEQQSSIAEALVPKEAGDVVERAIAVMRKADSPFVPDMAQALFNAALLRTPAQETVLISKQTAKVAERALTDRCAEDYYVDDGKSLDEIRKALGMVPDPSNDIPTPAQDSAVEGWQPIETAPKDETVILVYREDQGVFTAHFIAANKIIGIEGDAGPQWWSTDGGDLTGDLMPTHWMPLPAAPAVDGGAK